MNCKSNENYKSSKVNNKSSKVNNKSFNENNKWSKADNKSKKVLYAALVLAAVLLIWFIWANRDELWNILVPFLIAFFISYLIAPPVKKLEAKGIPRRIGILIIYLAVISLVAAAVIFLLPLLFQNMKELAEMLPDIAARYTQYFDEMVSAIKYSKWSEDIKAAILDEIRTTLQMLQDMSAQLLRKAMEGVAGTMKLLLRTTVAMVIAYYFVKDAEKLKKSFFAMAPRTWRESLEETGAEISKVFSRFIKGQVIVTLIVGVLEIIGLYIVGLDYAPILGIIGGIANIIPYFGPYIGAVPAVALAFIESPLKALWTVLVFFIVQQIDNSVITPRIIRERMGLHPVATILVILAGGTFFGVFGMLFAVPVTAVIRIILKRAIRTIMS
jgi:sporulation integral membrane protein YtvI